MEAVESFQPVDADLIDQMRSWRRHLHANPELGYEEHDTSAFIRSLLDEWDLPYETPLSTATLVHVRGEIPGPTLLIRADIDALPVPEEKEVAYASTRPGVMHACGHDGHTAMVLGLAYLLSRQPRHQMRGEIRLLFQPAEEPVDAGAVKMIEAGVLDGAMAVVGLHLAVGHNSPTGTIQLQAGAVQANDDRFDITVVGSAGHAASPQNTTDALTIAAGLVMQLQTLVSRRVSPMAPAVVTIGSLHAGTVYNAIPGEARLSGTVRALSPTTRDRLESELVALSSAYAAAHHARAEVEYRHGPPVLINHPDAVDFVRPAAEAAVGPDHVKPQPATMGGDDFAYYGQHLPSAYVFIGADNTGTNFPHHHPRFDFNEDALAVGLRFLHNVAQRWTDPGTPIPDLKPERASDSTSNGVTYMPTHPPLVPSKQ